MRQPLVVPDSEQCQLGVGNLSHARRCDQRAAYVVTDKHPRADGGYDTYAACPPCLQRLHQRFGEGAFNVATIIED